MSRAARRTAVSAVAGTWCCVALAVLGESAARAETVDQAYQSGLQHYYAGRHARAIEVFERIVAVPTHHEDLFYNLGCAYYRLGKLGPAIYNFERSLAIAPDRDDARFNLKTARSLLEGRVKDVLKGAGGGTLWVRVVSAFGQLGWSSLFLVLWWLLFALFFVLRRVGSGPLRAGLVAASSLIALVTLLCATLLVGRIYLDQRVELGVILPDRVAVHEGTATATKKLFHLHAGLTVRLIGEDSGWIRIRLDNGLEGWVERQQIGRL